MTATSLNSKYRVNSNGFALFVIGLTLAGFLGGAVRFFLNSDRAQDRILTELKRKLPEWQIEADRVHLFLASGIWPGLTVVVPSAKLIRQGDCDLAQVRIRLDDLRLPISLWSIFKGQNRLGDAFVRNIDVEMDQDVCSSGKAGSEKSQSSSEQSSSSPSSTELQNLGLKKTFDEFERRISSLTVEKFTFTDSRELSWSIGAQPLVIEVGSWVRATGKFSVWKRFAAGELKQNFDVAVNLQGSLLDWKIKTNVKEGEIEWYGQLDELGRTFLQRISTKQGPIADFADFFRTAGIIDRTVSTRRAWLNCRISQGGSFRKLRDVQNSAIRIEACGLEGEGGRAHIAPVTFYLKPPYLRNGPLEISVQQLPLQVISETAGLKIADRVISDMGRFSGRSQIYAPEKWNVRGELEGLRLSISNQSLRGTETIASLRLLAEKHWDELKVSLSDFKIPGGSRGGEIRLNFDPKSQRGTLDWNFEALSLSSTVQGLLFRGTGAPIKFKGHGILESGKLNDFSANFSWPEAQGNGWTMKAASGDIRFKDEVLSGRVSLERFIWNSSYTYFQFLEDLKARLKIQGEASELDRVKMDVFIHSQGGKVTQASAQLGKDNLNFVGDWVRSGSLKGEISKVGIKPKARIEISSRQSKLF